MTDYALKNINYKLTSAFITSTKVILSSFFLVTTIIALIAPHTHSSIQTYKTININTQETFSTIKISLLDSLNSFSFLPKSDPIILKDNAIYVRGGGFSGYFWTLGWLNANIDKKNNQMKDYYCYSGGCLSVVSHLIGASLEVITETGEDLQAEWLTGKLSRYSIISKFIDSMYTKAGVYNLRLEEQERILSQINVMLTTTELTLAVESPKDWESLKILLIQTSWIPFITGSPFTPFYNGYIDGWICSLVGGHPVFRDDVPDFPWTGSGLKVSLSKEDAIGIYEKGMMVGGS